MLFLALAVVNAVCALVNAYFALHGYPLNFLIGCLNAAVAVWMWTLYQDEQRRSGRW
jgi:hypothetical protein